MNCSLISGVSEMAKDGTKSAEIMRLYSHGIFTVKEIAEKVGCLPSYVRVVARQRKGTGMSVSEARYRQASTKWQELNRAKSRRHYHRVKEVCDDSTLVAARKVAREAYRKARDAGRDCYSATKAGKAARNRLLNAIYKQRKSSAGRSSNAS